MGRRDRSELIHRVLNQGRSVRSMLADTPYADVPVEGALAWREVEGLPILHSINAPRVIICGVRKIAVEAARPGALSERRVNALAGFLDRELPPA